MTLDELKQLIDHAAGKAVTFVFNVSLSNMAGNVDETPKPPTQPKAKYRVQTDKPNGKVKVRTSPSPSVDGPTVTEGTIVFGTGNKESRYETLWIEIETDSYLRGWVEDFNLVSVK